MTRSSLKLQPLPPPRKTLALLSGGMDSTFAAYWAHMLKSYDLQAAAFFNYGQKGAGFEWQAAKKIADELGIFCLYNDVTGLAPLLSGAIMGHEQLPAAPDVKDKYGQPATFVPGRNLIHLALLAPILYRQEVEVVVGGWNSIDVEYPDCTADFLDAAAAALTLALGRNPDMPIVIKAPAIRITKAEEVRKGVCWDIPWGMTRSCYSDECLACGHCDSCLVRARAFYANDLIDPAFTPKTWKQVVRLLHEWGYLDASE